MGKQEKIDKLTRERQEICAEMTEIYNRHNELDKEYFEITRKDPESFFKGPLHMSVSTNDKLSKKLFNQHDKLAKKAEKLRSQINKAGGSV